MQPKSKVGRNSATIWILQSSTYTQLYHAYFTDFMDSVDISAMITHAAELIAPYVEQDPTKFCTYEEHLTGVTALQAFCDLRIQSVRAQLGGDDTPVDTGTLDLTDLGTMNRGGMGGGFDRSNRGDRQWQTETPPQAPATAPAVQPSDFPGQSMQPLGQPTAQSTPENLLTIGLSVGILLIGLLIARKYRR